MCSIRKGFIKNFTKFTGKHLCQSPFFNKVAGLRSATLLKKRLWHRSFPVKFVKFLKTNFLQNTSGQLHLQLILGSIWLSAYKPCIYATRDFQVLCISRLVSLIGGPSKLI